MSDKALESNMSQATYEAFNPHRAARSDWWATWKGQELAVGHFKWIDWKTMRYVDKNAAGSTAETETGRSRRVRELLENTGVLLIQDDGVDFAFAGWHSAWEVSGLEWYKNGNWFECKLDKRLA